MKSEVIFFSLLVIILQVIASPLRPLKRSPRKISLKDASSVLGKMLGTSSQSIQGKFDPKKIKIPQYMLDLFSLLSDKNGNIKKNIPLVGSVVRSFFNEAPQSNSERDTTFYFNVADIARTEVIHRAELRLYQKKSHAVRRQASSGSRHHFYSVEIRQTGTNLLLGSKILSSRGFGWHTIDMKEAVQSWVTRPATNKGFEVIVKAMKQGTQKSDIQFVMGRNDEREAILVVYSHDKLSNRKPLNTSVNGDAGQDNKLTHSRKARGLTESGCRRVDMMVDIEKINWDRWILQPKVFNAYRCLGDCGVFSQKNKEQTNHATVQAILSETQSQTNRDVNAPCCAPKELESMAMLIFEQVGGSFLLKLQTLDNIRVKKCACL